MTQPNYIKVKEIEQIPWERTINPEISEIRFSTDAIVRNLTGFTGMFEIRLTDGIGTFPEQFTEIGITINWTTAVDCLGLRIFPASVIFASIAVECALNHDLRLESYRQSMDYEWIDLNFKNLKKAHQIGLPTDLLLKNNESFENNTRMEFVDRRNKVAHGDGSGYASIVGRREFTKGAYTSDAYQAGSSSPTRDHAIDQIETARKFIVAWASQSPTIRMVQFQPM